MSKPVAYARRAALVLATTLACASAPRAWADDGKDPPLRETVVAYRVEAKLKVPPSVVFEPSRLGHAVIPARFALTNLTRTAVPLGARQVEFLARGPLAVHACEVRAPDGDRWPATLEPGATTNVERTIVCETSLPGAYEIEARFDGTPASDPALASAPLQIEPGPSPPVPLSTRPALRAIATGTREVEPSQAPGRVRIVLGLTNATARAVPLPTVVVETALRLRGSPLTCRDRREVPLAGELGAGRQHTLWMPLSCALPSEGDWEVEIDVGEPSGPPVRLPKHLVHVSAVARPLPPPPR